MCLFKDFFFSVEMLNEDQINCLMLDPNSVCEEVLGTPIAEVVVLPQLSHASQQAK